ncbi:MAG TPA: hypothetical protein VKA53_02150 [Thermoanaerobaculia bacterium]|nr:hypothetical protein [Thermoanaerobaculia bacterium]
MSRNLLGVAVAGILLLAGANSRSALGASPPIVQEAAFDVGGAHVVAYVPWDLRAGELVTGVIEISGTKSQKQALRGYHLDINGSLYSLDSPSWGKTTSSRASALRFRVLAPDRRVVALAVFKVEPVVVVKKPATFMKDLPTPLPKILDHLSGFDLPETAVAGKPFRILGPYDGNIQNDVVRIGGKRATILTESMRSLVVRAPRALVGKQDVQLYEGGMTAGATIRMVDRPRTAKLDRWKIITGQFVRADRITEPQALRALCDWVAEVRSDLKETENEAGSRASKILVNRARKVRKTLTRCCPAAGKNLSSTAACVNDSLDGLTLLDRGRAIWSRGSTYMSAAVESVRSGDPDCILIESTLEYLGQLATATGQASLAGDVSRAQGLCNEVWLGRKPEEGLKASLAAVSADLSTLEHLASDTE